MAAWEASVFSVFVGMEFSVVWLTSNWTFFFFSSFDCLFSTFVSVKYCCWWFVPLFSNYCRLFESMNTVYYLLCLYLLAGFIPTATFSSFSKGSFYSGSWTEFSTDYILFFVTTVWAASPLFKIFLVRFEGANFWIIWSGCFTTIFTYLAFSIV